jgi:hypothetical protein
MTLIFATCGKADTADENTHMSPAPIDRVEVFTPENVKLEYQVESKITALPLTILNDANVRLVLNEPELDIPGVKQIHYRDMSAEQPDIDIYSYLEIAGIKYEIGKVGYGEPSVFPSVTERLRFSPFAGVLTQTDIQILTQYRFLGAKYDLVDYYVIENGAPIQIAEITGVVEYSDVDGDEISEVISTDYGARTVHITITKFDFENGCLRNSNIAELLGVDSVDYQEKLWFTRIIDTATNEMRDGYKYKLINGEFVPVDD